jgi:hypothetical protein
MLTERVLEAAARRTASHSDSIAARSRGVKSGTARKEPPEGLALVTTWH